MEGPQVLANKESSKEGGLLGEWKQIKDNHEKHIR
jgi:hypothetical protein